MRLSHCTPVVLILASALSGCASYRYDLSAVDGPPGTESLGVPMNVVKDRDLVVPATPARLRLRQVESRCVLMIENPTDAEITLDGAGSAIVDPQGQSRYVPGQLIPPGSFVKFVLPPLRDQPPTGPAFQFGIGVMADAESPRPAQFLSVGQPQEFWEWDGEGNIRIVLSLKQSEKTTRHAFVLTRIKQ